MHMFNYWQISFMTVDNYPLLSSQCPLGHVVGLHNAPSLTVNWMHNVRPHIPAIGPSWNVISLHVNCDLQFNFSCQIRSLANKNVFIISSGETFLLCSR